MATLNGPTRFLSLSQGRIAYDDTGGVDAPVVLVPGVGDLRSEYRFVRGPLAGAGHRVVSMDLRGHGESDATFPIYGGEAVGGDIIELVRHLDAGPAALVGCSMAAGSVVYAAAEAPELVSRLVLVNGFTRGPFMGWAARVLVRTLMSGPWRVPVWLGMYDTLFKLGPPQDHAEHRANMARNLREPGRSAAFGQMVLAGHAYAEARFDGVEAPSLFVMGTADPDFPDPRAEAMEVAGRLGGQARFVEGAGHYPHVEAPEQFLAAVLPFLARRDAAAG